MTIRALFALALVALLTVPAIADQWYWFTPQAGVSDGDFVSEVGIPTNTVRISPTNTGDPLWYYVPLPGLPAGAVIDSLTVCHDIVNASTFISQVRLTQLANPNGTSVIHDDGTDITLQGGRCTTQAVSFDFELEGAVHLALRIEAASTGHWIELGGIGVKVVENVVAVHDDGLPGASDRALLDQNHPNPFNPQTTIRFALPAAQRVDLAVYTVDGKRVATLHEGRLEAGDHALTWNGRDERGRAMPSGVYLYRLEAGERVESRRMALIR